MITVVIGLCLMSFVPTSVYAHRMAIEKDDNLGLIGQDLTVKELKAINHMKSTIIIEDDVESDKTYNVRKGDTLTAIGQRYDVTVAELMTWNQLSSDLIYVDQELIVNEEAAPIPEHGEIEVATSQVVEKPESETNEEESEPVNQSSDSNRSLTMTATAYTAECEGCTGITATGINLNEDRTKKVVAVDPSVIPLGTRVYVEGYGEAIAGDVGGAIKGNKIDIHVPTKEEAFQWGVREVNVTIIE